MSLNDNAVITVAELKSRLQINQTKDVDDAYYETMINAVSNYIENYLDRKVIAPSSAEEEIFDGTGLSSYYVDNRRFQNVDVAVPVISQRGGDGTSWDVLSISNYPREFVNKSGLVYLVSSVFTAGTRNYKISHKYGWLITEVPEAIKLAAAELVTRSEKRIDKTGITSIVVGGSTTAYDLAALMNGAIKGLLAQYRRITFG